MIFEYESGNGTRKIESSTLKTIFQHLNEINPRLKSYFILTKENGDYLQCAGSKLRLTIEYKQSETHSVLGIEKENKEPISINYSGGAISLKRNEILSISDALKTFETFFNTGNVPNEYILRKVDEH
ncbi:hypothetical protein [Litchfieldia salsa]|uniref:Uncharacterized protein n=1 Tax=Litchfieldia salsa TaxID=930152 RepID=A0A1H0TX90_9BACI|nr:hypothetical protein [Litchfieldia salsa]SDP58579.1 hypothetical protein SAMN05216565_1044 [Litchfieldia salsa]